MEGNELTKIKRQLGPCFICSKSSKYVCPKCSIKYCSLQCYKQHNTNCTEEFYKENVIQWQKNEKSTKENIKSMKEILERQRNDIDDEIEDKQIDRLLELETLIEDGKLQLDQLTLQEQDEFKTYIDSNEVQDDMKEWTPFWKSEEGLFSLYVEEIVIEDEIEVE